MPCEYAHGLLKLFFEKNDVTLLPGGQFTAKNATVLTIHGQNRAGYTVASNSVEIDYEVNDLIEIALNPSNITDATDFHTYLLCVDGVQIAIWTNPSIPIRLFRDAHIQKAPAVTTLPTEDDLIFGMARLHENIYKVYKNTWTPIPGNPYLGTILDPTQESGCAQDVTGVTQDVITEAPLYSMDGEPSPSLKLYWRNDSIDTIPMGATFGIDIFLGGLLKTQLLSDFLKVKMWGIVNLNNGELLTNLDLGGWQNWYYGQVLTLHDNLLPNHAYFVEIAVQFAAFEVKGIVSNGTPISIVINPIPVAGILAMGLANFIGQDIVFATGDKLAVVPDKGGNVDILSGSALVRNFVFPQSVKTPIYGVIPFTKNQKITIDGHGSFFYRGTEAHPTSEAVRAKVSCEEGYSMWSAFSEIRISNNSSLQLALEHPDKIRADYPTIGGKKAEVPANVQIAIAIVFNNQIIYLTTQPLLETIVISSLNEWQQVVTLPLPPHENFCLFAAPNPIVTSLPRGELPEANYQIAIAYYLNGQPISSVTHSVSDGCIATMPGTFQSLFQEVKEIRLFQERSFVYLNQPQTYQATHNHEIVTLIIGSDGLLKIDCNLSASFRVMFIHHITSIVFENLKPGSDLKLVLRSCGCDYTVNWGNIKWNSTTPPALVNADGGRDVFNFFSEEGAIALGSHVGSFR
jgi:hypothetical protein